MILVIGTKGMIDWMAKVDRRKKKYSKKKKWGERPTICKAEIEEDDYKVNVTTGVLQQRTTEEVSAE